MGWFIFLLLTLSFIIFFKPKKFKRAAEMVKHLPGPTPLPLIGNLHYVLFLSRFEFIKLNDYIDRTFGSIYKVFYGTRPEVHMRKPEYLEAILNNSIHIEKGIIYDLLHPWLGTGLLTSTGQKWFTHRKMLTPTFHFKILENFIDIFNENSKILVDRIRLISSRNEAVDVFPVISRCALDIICETAMGTKINAQSKDNSEYVKAIYIVSEITAKRHFKPWLLIDKLFYMLAIGKQYKKQLNILHNFTNDVITEKMKNMSNRVEVEEENDIGSKKKKMFLDLLLEANTLEVNKLTKEEIREEVDTFMFEGHDTTTASMSWTLFLLAQHPEIQENVYEELQSIYQDEPNRPPTMKDLNEMKYLERVIKESLRMFPSVPFIIRHLNEDLNLGEHQLPKDIEVIIHIRDLHRDPDIYPNPENFDPDRFSPEHVKERHPYAYIPFSAGSRNCIGQKFAMLEEKAVLSELVRNFYLKTNQKLEDLNLLLELVVRPYESLELYMTPRN